MDAEVKELTEEIAKIYAKLHNLPMRKQVIKAKVMARFTELRHEAGRPYYDSIKKNSENPKQFFKTQKKLKLEIEEKIKKLDIREKSFLKRIENEKNIKSKIYNEKLNILKQKLQAAMNRVNKEIYDNVSKGSAKTGTEKAAQKINKFKFGKGKIIITASIIASLIAAAYIQAKRSEKKRLEKLKKGK